MIKVGITGQTGFIGTHLFNSLGLLTDEFIRIPFKDSFFTNQEILYSFVKNCDVIVHLAAMNRHNDPEVLYKTNIWLCEQIISACEATQSVPHIIFSSSTQEERDNLYGRSKKVGRELFEEWAIRNNARFTGFVIPNVYGPFGNPYYNSVVATFCHQLTHDESPSIKVDAELKMIFVDELIRQIIGLIWDSQDVETGINKIAVKHTVTIHVSELLDLLNSFRGEYLENGNLPDFKTFFEQNLFNTFVCYADHESLFPFRLNLKTDDRGSFAEIMRLCGGGQVSFSTTVPGVTRGNHFHTRKAERFVVIKGKARIKIRRIGTDRVVSFDLTGDEPSFVDMPIWHTHNITNVGQEELYTIFWINEFYDPNDPDTFFEPVEPELSK